MNLPPQVQQVFERVDAMTLRERAMLMAALIAVLFMFWDTFLMRPLNALHDTRGGQLESLQQQVGDLNEAIQAAVSEERIDPDQAARRELAGLRSRLIEVDRRLEEAARGLIEPGEMGRVLDALLSRTDGLELVAMRNLEPQALGSEDASSGGAAYYRHGIELEVSGPYHAVLDYLREVEGSKWEFVWGGVDLKVDEYPRNTTRIVLYTFSQREGLLGV